MGSEASSCLHKTYWTPVIRSTSILATHSVDPANLTVLTIIHSRIELVLLLRVLVSIASITLLVTSYNGGKFSESTLLLNFIRAVDPENVLRIERNRIVSDPCSYKWKGVKCN
ncbi:Protein kinase domain-containing protein [Forsythia ovata]|uniref:Protein kinase domain-containing protein n=1 Tax=Forsythia ovata TaxID=205694 RepID=A0ABD1WSC1_9LAMI